MPQKPVKSPGSKQVPSGPHGIHVPFAVLFLTQEGPGGGQNTSDGGNKARSKSIAAGLEGTLLVTELELQGMRVGSSRLVWDI